MPLLIQLKSLCCSYLCCLCGQCTWKTIFHNIITSLQSEKTAVFRVINEVTENLVKVRWANI